MTSTHTACAADLSHMTDRQTHRTVIIINRSRHTVTVSCFVSAYLTYLLTVIYSRVRVHGLSHFHVNETGLIIMSGIFCVQQVQCVKDSSDGRPDTESRWQLVDQIIVNHVFRSNNN